MHKYYTKNLFIVQYIKEYIVSLALKIKRETVNCYFVDEIASKCRMIFS